MPSPLITVVQFWLGTFTNLVEMHKGYGLVFLMDCTLSCLNFKVIILSVFDN